MHITTRRRHPGGHPTSSIQAPAAHAHAPHAYTWGTSSVTCRPHWRATPAEKQGNRRLGRLPMRNGSRPGKAQPCESA